MTVQPVEEMVLRLEELLFPSIANVAVLSADVDDETVRIEAQSAVAGDPSVRTADRAPAVDASRGRPRARRPGRAGPGPEWCASSVCPSAAAPCCGWSKRCPTQKARRADLAIHELGNRGQPAMRPPSTGRMCPVT